MKEINKLILRKLRTNELAAIFFFNQTFILIFIYFNNKFLIQKYV